MAIDHLILNATNYYPLNQNSDSITVGSRTFKEYKFQKYSTKLTNVGTNRFTLIDDYHKLDMNKYTIVTFDNGDVYKALNYELYKHLDESSAFYNPTSNGNQFFVELGNSNTGNSNSILVDYFRSYEDSDSVEHATPIDVKWCQIEINVD